MQGQEAFLFLISVVLGERISVVTDTWGRITCADYKSFGVALARKEAHEEDLTTSNPSSESTNLPK